jgi:hypothetical protein
MLLAVCGPGVRHTDWNKVCAHHRSGRERENSVERDSASDINQRNDAYEDGGRDDCIRRYVEVGVDLCFHVLARFDTRDARHTHCSKPSGEWQTVVACESKQLPRAGGQGADCYHGQKDHDDAHETSRSADAFRCVLENVNERVSGRARQCFLYVANAEGVHYQQNEREGQIEEERNDHCLCDNRACIFDLLGHVGNRILTKHHEHARDLVPNVSEQSGWT